MVAITSNTSQKKRENVQTTFSLLIYYFGSKASPILEIKSST